MSARPLVRLLLALLLALGTVAPANALASRSLSVAVNPGAAVSGTVVTFSGRLTRSPKGSLVRIQRKAGSSWQAVRSVRTSTATGRYQAKVRLPTVVGVYAFRAVAPRTGSRAAATSRTVKVSALELTFVSLSASPQQVTAGASTTLSGFVSPHTTGTPVLLQRRSGSTWASVATVYLNAKGLFSRSVAVPASTSFRAVVARSGRHAAGYSSAVPVAATAPGGGDHDSPPPPVIATSSLPAATAGSPYTATLAAVGGVTGTWTTSTLPAGLALDPATGEIHGTPTTAGTTHLVVGFTQTGNPAPATAKTLDLVVQPRPAPVISTTSLPDGKVLQAYAGQLSVTGNLPGTWSITGKPSWLKLDATTGALSGTPGLFDNGDDTITVGFTETGNPTPASPVTLTIHVAGLG